MSPEHCLTHGRYPGRVCGRGPALPAHTPRPFPELSSAAVLATHLHTRAHACTHTWSQLSSFCLWGVCAQTCTHSDQMSSSRGQACMSCFLPIPCCTGVHGASCLLSAPPLISTRQLEACQGRMGSCLGGICFRSLWKGQVIRSACW